MRLVVHARMFLAAMALCAAWAPQAAARDLMIVARGEGMQTALTNAYRHPFTEATRIETEGSFWEGGLDPLRERLKSPDNTWDVIITDPDELATGCAEGLFERLDWSAIGGKDHYQALGVSECGLAALVATTVLAWDRDKFPMTPSWADFWDVAKVPGKRGLGKSARGVLEIALLADGVAPGDVYKTLASKDGTDRAFQKLDQLRPYIVWWQTEADAARILASGDVLMTSAQSGVIATAARLENRAFGIQWNASLTELFSWAIAKASPNLRAAQQFLYFTGMPAIQTRLLRTAGQAGLAKGLNESLPPELQPISPTAAANSAGALRVDAAFWHENETRLRQRFETWLSPAPKP